MCPYGLSHTLQASKHGLHTRLLALPVSLLQDVITALVLARGIQGPGAGQPQDVSCLVNRRHRAMVVRWFGGGCS